MDPDLDQRPWRRFFIRVTAGRRSAHLHLMTAGDERWSQHSPSVRRCEPIPSLAAAYAELKRDLAARHTADREGYTAAKSDFVRMVLDRSG